MVYRSSSGRHQPILVQLIPSVEPVILRGGLAPTPEVMSQLSGAEWLWNLPGTADDAIAQRATAGLQPLQQLLAWHQQTHAEVHAALLDLYSLPSLVI